MGNRQHKVITKRRTCIVSYVYSQLLAKAGIHLLNKLKSWTLNKHKSMKIYIFNVRLLAYDPKVENLRAHVKKCQAGSCWY